MTACVFLGPTLPLARARQALDAEYLPPVRQGDVYRAVTRYRPRAIGIVDGYFHQVPSVWHKEILWAMAKGVHVFGSASMGALRAAELHRFGMHGVGEVFAAFRDGIIEDDDEVAVIHGPPETGFLAASEAMVNIRRTLADAESCGIVAVTTRRKLEELGKSLFYPLRSYPALLKMADAAGVDGSELAAFRDWLEEGRADVKRRDALQMLGTIGELLSGDPVPKQIGYSFEHTTLWEEAVLEMDAGAAKPLSDRRHSEEEWLLDELRLEGDAYQRLRHVALLRLLARREAARGGEGAGDDEIRQATTEFRLRHGLILGRDLERWLSDRGLTRRMFEKLMEENVLMSRLAGETRGQFERYLIEELQMDGDYGRIADRARAKRQALREVSGHAQDERLGQDDAGAVTWYFAKRLGRSVPEDLDGWAARSGFESAAAFRRAVIREYRYQIAGQKG
jgi:hypothetical protein